MITHCDPFDNWSRVSKENRCPICGKPDWCLLSNDGSAVICPRTAEGSVRNLGDAGYLHLLSNPGSDRQRSQRNSVRFTVRNDQPRDWSSTVASCREVRTPRMLAALIRNLGVSLTSLDRLCVGWSVDHDAWAFPMQDASGNVCGIRLRDFNGRKRSIKGSRQGLFVPSEISGDKELLICEGPTDTAASLDLGYEAIGRPSCNGGTKLIEEWVRNHQPESVIVVADADLPGQHGASKLATTLAPLVPSVQMIVPPEGINDVREWKKIRKCQESVIKEIQEAQTRKIMWRVKVVSEGDGHGDQ